MNAKPTQQKIQVGDVVTNRHFAKHDDITKAVVGIINDSKTSCIVDVYWQDGSVTCTLWGLHELEVVQ